jgi:HD-GYP domain-containing protein (c-di-GMP phosphodiesterase class II)/CHASE1-domain containing sensor protein
MESNVSRRLEKFTAPWGFQPTRRSVRRVAVVMTACIGLGLTIGFFLFMRSSEWEEKQVEFDYATQPFVEALRAATERIEFAHEMVRQDYYGSEEVTREEFSLFIDTIWRRVPSLKVLQWAPRVEDKQRKEYEQTARREGYLDYRIVEPDATGKLVPAKRRDEHFPIWYAATASGFNARFGWDFAADPILIEAMRACCDKDRFTISASIDLSNIGLYPHVVQTFLPIYRNPRGLKNEADRRANLVGYLVGLCQLDDMLKQAFHYASGPQGMDLALYDGSTPGNDNLLCFYKSRTRSAKEAEGLKPAKEPEGIHHEATMEFGGRRWQMVFTPAPRFFAARASWRSWTILAVGLVVTLVSTLYVRSALTRTERIEHIVDMRTKEVRLKDEQLRRVQEAKNRALRAAHEETIQRLVTASLCRDEETGMHIKRTGLLCECLARAMGWSAADAETLRLAAPMHDVGKIGIPDAILQKPGKLTPEEFNVMKTHTTIGSKMLEGSQSETLAMAQKIALCHHERWDGTGYPNGLAGTAIPEAARFVSIIDVYDALSHDRCYRPALPENEVLDFMAKGAGKQFDPALFAVFLTQYEELRRIAQENPDEQVSEKKDVALPATASTIAPIAASGFNASMPTAGAI